MAHLYLIYLFRMVIWHSYVSLLEGMPGVNWRWENCHHRNRCLACPLCVSFSKSWTDQNKFRACNFAKKDNTLLLHTFSPWIFSIFVVPVQRIDSWPKKKAAPGWSSGSGYWQPSYQAYLLKLTFRHAETTTLWANLSFNYHINWFICQYETKHHDIDGNEIWWINHCHICRYMN